MSTLVEQIEALQADCRERGDNVDGIYHPVAASAYGSFVGALDPILDSAREQKQELAALKAPKNVLIDTPQSKGICARCGKPVEVRIGQAWHRKSIGDGSSEYVWHEVCSYQDAIDAMHRQHSADLRAIAEMARLSCKNIIINQCREHGNWKKDGAPSKILRAEASDLIDGLSPDSIVREFREKKEKVGK